MSGEKKHWRLSTSLRRFSGTQDPPLKAEIQSPRSRVSSVYLANDSSTNGFIIVPEFDYPVQTRTTHDKSNHGSHPWPYLPTSPSSADAVDNYPTSLEPIGSQYSYLGGGSCDDDLTRRLGVAYERIRSMSTATPPKVLLSSDPQMLRKQLGVPQHSVFNHPIPSSLDLPNPYASLCEPTSPGSPSAPLPDVINMDTFILTASPPHHLQDPVQSRHSKSVVTTSTPTGKSPSQCSLLGTPRSTLIACTSKLVKRRVEKTTSSPSSLPSSARRAFRGGLRKPGPDTSPSENTHRRQLSLPQIRPPSPFMVDIPLHHSWHDRQTDLNSKIVQLHETNPRRTSGSTEVLASLAWIGTPYTANRICHPAGSASFPDRLSIGIAVEDDSISDDVLVDRLERARRLSDPSDPPRDGSLSRLSSNARGDENVLSPMFCPPTSSELSSTTDQLTSDSEDAAVWQAARKAFLCIREIVRTEKKYQEALKMLLNAQTATPPPSSMTPYVLALVRVSEMLLKHFLEDPSAWGVSAAFVTSEDEIEATMVSWCAVAGTFFTDRNDPQINNSMGRWRLRKSAVMSPPETNRTSISPSPQLPPMSSMVTSSKIKGQMVEDYRARRHSKTVAEKQTKQTSSMFLEKLESTSSQSPVGPSRKLSVRDLAIQPIQRVMRYVLLYRDLLDCTPATSPPRLLVQHALEAARRIAHHCDGAQRNPAFCHAS